jgi:hypothetical protein
MVDIHEFGVETKEIFSADLVINRAPVKILRKRLPPGAMLPSDDFPSERNSTIGNCMG